MLSVNDIVKWANEKICAVIPGLKSYGVTKVALKDGRPILYTEGQEYAGIDDTYPAQLYHKELSVSSTNVPRSGYGDNEQSLQNTYGMAMILYFNEKKCGNTADELYTFIQSSITGFLKTNGIRSTRVSVTSAILNDAQVWAQEYGQTPYKLFGPQRLIQVNYSITIVFDKNCISIPNCKN